MLYNKNCTFDQQKKKPKKLHFLKDHPINSSTNLVPKKKNKMQKLKDSNNDRRQ
jgi:hypothetical protein